MYGKDILKDNKFPRSIIRICCFPVSGIECMGIDCDVLVPEDFLCSVLSKPELRDRYSQLAFYDYVKVGVAVYG